MKTAQPYLNFDGNCREAMTFYQQCLGGKLTVMTFGETDPKAPPANKDRLIHARIEKGSFVLMASDTMPGMPYNQGNSVWLNVDCDTPSEVDQLFKVLGAGGKEEMAPHDAFWDSRFAMLTDRFGFHWMFNCALPKK